MLTWARCDVIQLMRQYNVQAFVASLRTIAFSSLKRARHKYSTSQASTMTSHIQPPKLDLLSWGEVGLVYKVSEDIALKYSIKDDDSRICNEYRIFDMLEIHPPCPHLVRSFLRLPNANFLQFHSGSTLDQRLQLRQTRDPTTKRVLKAEDGEPRRLVLRWMTELSDAAAWLESLGYPPATFGHQTFSWIVRIT